MKFIFYFSSLKHLKIITFIIMTSINSFNCSSSNEYIQEKMDPALHQKIYNLEETGSDSTVQFIGKCTTDISPEIENELKSSGIILGSIAGDIFTARGNYSSIKKVTLLDVVSSLELERKMDIK